jgi:hypothetical protein
MDAAKVATAGLLGFGYLIAHNVADHWVQTTWEANNKGRKDSTGRAACLSHVVTYTFTITTVICALALIFHLPITWYGVLAGLAISAVTHYWADRRFTLQWFAGCLGKAEFYKLGQPRDITAHTVVRKTGEEASTLRLRTSEDTHKEITWDNPSLGTGAYVLDQSWHWFWILVATVVTVVV